VQVSTGATEMGQGVNTKIKQLVAEEFGIDPRARDRHGHVDREEQQQPPPPQLRAPPT